ncbi:hypothetical protein [Streptomyces celluloflavus]|uniref:Uncharacterized protein n=1 Tax=Streptomyces celluloflavus TaxID=58344 RepID=A0ABW7RKA1_9ACTN|nr:hypothetical protein OG717_33425 [Streptomyces celluloflavus]
MATRTPMQPLGLGHWKHPLLGHRVIDHAHNDRIGILRAIAPDVKDNDPDFLIKVPDTAPVAWLAPVAGGVEWTTDPDAIEVAKK